MMESKVSVIGRKSGSLWNNKGIAGRKIEQRISWTISHKNPKTTVVSVSTSFVVIAESQKDLLPGNGSTLRFYMNGRVICDDTEVMRACVVKCMVWLGEKCHTSFEECEFSKRVDN